jgi:hypothetical protein
MEWVECNEARYAAWRRVFKWAGLFSGLGCAEGADCAVDPRGVRE